MLTQINESLILQDFDSGDIALQDAYGAFSHGPGSLMKADTKFSNQVYHRREFEFEAFQI